MSQTTIHNPDRYMVDLRQILSQGKKRIGLFLGAGCPVAVRVNADGVLDEDGDPLIPDVARLTTAVVNELEAADRAVVDLLLPELGDNPNIETILTRVRRLSQAIGAAQIHGLDGPGYEALAQKICEKIGGIVAAGLPDKANAFTELVSWIGGTNRDHPIEIFTPNYDLLLEEAFERSKLPYFDGFTGAHRPFFDPTSIRDGELPARWSRVWKIHGSLGWDIQDDAIVRTGSRNATELIYPDHLKYDQIARQPFSSLFERLRAFLTTPDSLLLCSGFSFFDAHITSVIDEALAANTHTAVVAFQFGDIDTASPACKVALRRPNLSVYARDGAVIHGVPGKWQPGQPPSEEWVSIRRTFWQSGTAGAAGAFLLGDFAKFARFLGLSQASEFGTMAKELDVSQEESDVPASDEADVEGDAGAEQ
ncbi:SIR2 family protein [Tritonibacter mobilis]|uniref:SIR2 family protein n=1 Tax=Tritonibacter mobilis TaxID=379347 RepID=UPI001C0889B6|nr:SIR2 family protein [Tritonibacter mobilis]MBU3036475.1 SIR2 family protein [Tritonibacter mobilis]WHQ84216.1 SIR2 family protein [Tritonibacter mobilis]